MAVKKAAGRLKGIRSWLSAVLAAVRSKGVPAEVIAEINDDNKEIFEYNRKTVAIIPNKPSRAELEEPQKKA